MSNEGREKRGVGYVRWKVKVNDFLNVMEFIRGC